MRQLKFRAWDGKQMQTDFNLFSEGGAFSIDGNEEVFRHENWIVMQFTGLKDKNGKEIYEGDIISYKFKTKTSNDSFESPVFFDEYMWLTNEHSINRINDVEIIGNIHEHKHLIEKEAVK